MRRLAPAAIAIAGLVACSGTTSESPPPGAPTSEASPPVAQTSASPASSSSASSPSPSSAPASPDESPAPEPSSQTHEFSVTEHESFNEPWALEFLPGTDTAVITERVGTMKLRDADGTIREVSGVPDVIAAGQGGLGDIIVGPNFETDGTVYLSWVEAGEGGTGAVVGTATLDVANAALNDVTRIWQQTPKVDGRGHFSHRLEIRDDYLFVSSGDRQKMEPAQEMDTTLGKILRLTLDGQPAPDNPFAGEDAPAAQQFWSIGHRNVLGLDFDAEGRLWASEMGPEGGDELNLIEPGLNYGWPAASNGSHYGGDEIPDHAEGDGFAAPKAWWTPSVSPGSLLIYQGDLFPGWKGDAFLGALSGQALIRVELDGKNATEQETWPMDARIREVEEGPDGAIWLLQDKAGGHLLELRPAGP